MNIEPLYNFRESVSFNHQFEVFKPQIGFMGSCHRCSCHVVETFTAILAKIALTTAYQPFRLIDFSFNNAVFF